MTNNRILTAPLIASFAAIAVCDLAFGLTLQLQPLLMEARGIPAWLIGTIVAAGPLGILIFGSYMPRIIARFGARQVAAGAMITLATTMLLFKVITPLWAWFALRFIFGIATSALFVVSETWAVTMATDENRGRVMGIYSSILTVTFGIGPLLLPYTGITGWTPWLMCAFVILLGLIPLKFVGHTDFNQGEEKGHVLDVLKRQPLMFVCALTCILFDGMLISFFTIFATRSGVPLAQASSMLGISIIAGVLFYYPLGMLADKWSRNGVVIGSSVITVVLALAIVPLLKTIFIWPVLMLFVAMGFGGYIMTLAAIGSAFTGKDIIAASAAITSLWGIGGLLGPPICGRLIDYFGANALPYTLAGLHLFLLIVLACNGFKVMRDLQNPSTPAMTPQ